MRYRKLFAVALLGALWAQGVPWTRWSWYRSQAGVPVGPPLPDPLLTWSGDTVWAIVDTSGMAAAGIVRWQWIGGVSSPTNDTTYKALVDYTTFSIGKQYAIGLVVFYANGDSALSYKTAMLRRNWATLANYSTANYACPGGEIWALPDIVNTDIDSARLYIGQNGVPLDSSPMLTRLNRWVFRAPTTPGTYDLWGRTYLREGRTGVIPIFPATQVTVAPSPPPSLQLACVNTGTGEACPNEPVELSLLWYTEIAAPPSSPPQWDFNGDNVPDATGWRVSATFPAPGTYPVQATVQVPGGCQLSFSGGVVVSGGTLNRPTVGFPSTFAVGYPVQARIVGAKGLISCDWEADGTWEAIGLMPVGSAILQTPPYTFSAPPPAGGYRLLVKQELCGQARIDTFTWTPPTTAPAPDGGIAILPGTLLCPGDSLYVRLGALTNFFPGQPGHTVEWDFGSGFLPPTSRTDTALVWNGQPLTIRARLTNSAGSTRVLGPVTANRLSPAWLLPDPNTLGTRFRYRRAAPSTSQSFSVPQEYVFCGGDSLYFWISGAPAGDNWSWRLLLPGDTVTLPATQARAGYTWRLPSTSGLYTVEHQLVGSCGYTRREVQLFRTDQPTALHAGRFSYSSGCNSRYVFGDHYFITVCMRGEIPFFWFDQTAYGRGAAQRVRWTQADGTPLTVITTADGVTQVLAPDRPGLHLLYQIWEGCAGPDTVRFWVEVRDKPAAFFTGPAWGCVGQPVTFQRAPGLLSPGHPGGIQWRFEEPSAPDRSFFRYDTAVTQTYTWTQPGYYRVELTVRTPQCGTTTMARSIHIAAARPTVQITQATLQNGVLTFSGSASEADSVVWDFGDGTTLAGVLSGTHSYAGNGPYRVRLYAFNGCGGDMAEVIVTHLPVASPPPWRFYPNPASNQLWVEVPADDQGEVRLYSLIGQQVTRYAVQSGLNTLPLQGVPRGLYILELRGRQAASYHRLLIE